MEKTVSPASSVATTVFKFGDDFVVSSFRCIVTGGSAIAAEKTACCDGDGGCGDTKSGGVMLLIAGCSPTTGSALEK
ncbi:hypothetical protein A2U01_0055762 [Trifolium medium]|uniref:Uncharacterized protein n=1 Tax=Trifolium medium TaxID=97028 RepID=A0A392REI5_9FABA|nr:hypothetical protein [Trifolium medium]